MRGLQSRLSICASITLLVTTFCVLFYDGAYADTQPNDGILIARALERASSMPVTVQEHQATTDKRLLPIGGPPREGIPKKPRLDRVNSTPVSRGEKDRANHQVGGLPALDPGAIAAASERKRKQERSKETNREEAVKKAYSGKSGEDIRSARLEEFRKDLTKAMASRQAAILRSAEPIPPPPTNNPSAPGSTPIQPSGSTGGQEIDNAASGPVTRARGSGRGSGRGSRGRGKKKVSFAV